MSSTYYLGTGPIDIGNFLSFLGLPGGHAYCTDYYRNMDDVNKKLMDVCSEIVNEGLGAEIKATIKMKLEGIYTQELIGVYIQNFFTNSGLIPKEIKELGIIVSYDMGWNGRSTGRVYDSLSGHGYLIGCLSGCVISYGVKSKKCSKCTRAKQRGVEVGEHYCTVNHTGSSGAMEASLALDLITELFDKWESRIYVQKLVSGDDSTMRSLL